MSVTTTNELRIAYESKDFPRGSLPNGQHNVVVDWSDIVWSALTIGRPDVYYVFRHEEASLYEAIFRVSMLRMALGRTRTSQRLERTDAFKALDPTEKGAVNYFLGLVLCKVFSAELLNAPWLLHLDVFRSRLGAVTRLGRSRPDLFGQDPSSGAWHSFECKGRASAPSSEEKRKAKLQAQRLISVGGTRCTYHIGSFTFFQGDTLRFYWRDPPAKGRLEVPEPGEEWGAYYRPFVALWRSSRERGIRAEGKFPVDRDEDLDISLSIHPEVEGLLAQGNWAEARKVAIEMGASLKKDGYRPDGLAVRVGDSWSRTPRRRLKS